MVITYITFFILFSLIGYMKYINNNLKKEIEVWKKSTELHNKIHHDKDL